MQKVLIANRSEIAVRVIRACHDLGLQTVAVYSTADAESLHVLEADEAICIGKPQATESYLKVSRILSVCEITSTDAIHPGYGFLSENSSFAEICESSGINFIGPSSKSMALLGDKATAKGMAKEAGVPIIPGSDGLVKSPDEVIEIAKEYAYPVLIKASAGGGGKGMRLVMGESEAALMFEQAKLEAEKSFANGDLYVEKVILNPRHVEIQVMGDKHGNYVHLGERDCTIQRRRQKLIEEAPSPMLSPELRKKMGESAIALLKAANYHSLATVEFLLDKEGKFYFMEVNTRVQVEHTVTEELTGIDLVKEQLRISMGEKLSITQEDIELRGHVIEFRINAEDPSENFRPCPGKLEYYLPPGGPNVRVDSACYTGYQISPYYDSMIAKLIVRGRSRQEAFSIGKRALKEFHIGGVKTTIPFHQEMLEDDAFTSGTDYDLNYIDEKNS